MLDRQPPPRSRFSQIVHDRPGYSVLSVLLSLGNMALNPEYSFLTVASLMFDAMLGMELYNQFKYIKEPPHKLKSKFKNIRDQRFEKYGLLLGELEHHDEYEASLKIFSADPHLRAMTRAHFMAPDLAEAHFMAPDLADFNTEYFRYLFLMARLKKGPWFKDPVRQIAEKTRERGLELKPFDHLFHFSLQTVYTQALENNQANKMTLDDLIAMLTFCENVKGLGKGQGCSTWVTQGQSAHNLDWFTLGGKFPHFIRTVAEPGSRYFTFSVDAIPGFPTSAYNNAGLEVHYHEVGGDGVNRENPNGGWPGLALVKEIAANCGNISEVQRFLETHEPASVHNLIVRANDGHGVVQSMSKNSSSTFNVRGAESLFCVATNHHFDENMRPISESACITGPRKGSEERYARMAQAAAREEKPTSIAESAASEDTVVTSYYKKEGPRNTLKYNIANASSHTAPGEDSKMHYTTIHLLDFFQKLATQTKETSRKLTTEKQNVIRADLLTDDALIVLMRKLHAVGKINPALGSELSRFYSALNEELVKKTCMTRETIKEVADATIQIVDAVLDNNHQRAQELIGPYEKLLREKLPKGNLKFDGTRVVDALFIGYMCMMFSQMMISLMQKGSSSTVLEKASEDFSLLLNARKFMAIVSVLSTAYCLFKKPKLAETGEAVVKALRSSPGIR